MLQDDTEEAAGVEEKENLIRVEERLLYKRRAIAMLQEEMKEVVNALSEEPLEAQAEDEGVEMKENLIGQLCKRRAITVLQEELKEVANKLKRPLEVKVEAEAGVEEDEPSASAPEPKKAKREKIKMTCNQTAVALLQELCMKRKWNPPLYETIDISGPSNDPMFEVSVTLCNGIKGIGRGRQKKAAKHDAAKKALEQLNEKALTDGTIKPADTVQSKGPINPHEEASGLNAVGELQNLCMAKHFPAPEYAVIGDEGEPHEKLFTFRCTVSQRSATGIARKKQLAKHNSALAMLKILNSSMKTILDEIPNDPAVSSMYSQKSKEVPASVSEQRKKADAQVVERYKVLKDNISDIPSAPLISPGTKFSDYHLKFASQLESYKELLSHDAILGEANPFKKLQMVAEELQFKMCVTQERSKDGRFIVFVQLETEPPTIQAALHQDESAATQQAALNVLRFLEIMA